MKETIHIGIACVGETPTPTPGRLVSLAAAVGTDVWRANFQAPEDHPWVCPRYLTKYPKIWGELTEKPVALKEGLKSYCRWISRYHGTHIAVGRAMDFWWLYSTLIENTGKCSFGCDGLLDTATMVQIQRDTTQQLTKKHFWVSLRPWEAATTAWGVVVPPRKQGKK